MADDVFSDATAMGLRVPRSCTFLEYGGDRPNSDDGCSQGEDLWMQRRSDALGGPEYDTGPDGLQKLEYMLARANDLGIKLILSWNQADPAGRVDRNRVQRFPHRVHPPPATSTLNGSTYD